MIRRHATVVVALAILVTLLSATGASAHALRIASDPDAGAVVKRGPTAITITFGESPDPGLSSIAVLDSSGGRHQLGAHPSAQPGRPAVLSVRVAHMGDGVYTVTWRTVSKVDGHLAQGSFNFGVNVTPRAASAVVSSSVASPSVLALVGRWLFDAGLILLIGVACVGLLMPAVRSRLAVLAAASWFAAFVGSLTITTSARATAGLGWSDLFGHSLGHQLFERTGPLLVVGLALAVAIIAMRRRDGAVARGAPWFLVAALLGAIIGEIQTSHTAATSSNRWFALALLAGHIVAVGIWIGGLAAVLVGTRHLEAEARGVLVRRYSTVAGVMLLVVAFTGTQRAYVEVGSWSSFLHDSFGRWVLVKIVLFCVLASLGAVNRFRNVAASHTSVRGLVRVGAIELVVAAIVIVATGYLQNLAPSASTTANAATPSITVDAADAGTTTRVHLTIAPGYPGFNDFHARIVDYDTKRIVSASSVSVTFALRSRPDIARSRLDLRRATDGTWRANGANLSLPGRWNLTMLVARDTGSVEVPLAVTTRATPQTITSSVSPGSPTIYTIHVVGDRAIQVYTEKTRPGLYQVHVTYLDASGAELPLAQWHVRARRDGTTTTRNLTTRRLDLLGHLVSDLEATGGKYQIDTDAITHDGASVSGNVDIPLP